MKRVKVSPLSRVAPTPPRPARVVTGLPGTRASAKAQSSRTFIESRNPDPLTLPDRVPKNGRLST